MPRWTARLFGSINTVLAQKKQSHRRYTHEALGSMGEAPKGKLGVRQRMGNLKILLESLICYILSTLLTNLEDA